MDKKARTELFFVRLRAAPACGSVEDALEQVAQVLNRIEDEFTSIPFNPDTWDSDGRMYPPQEDRRRDVPGHPDIRRYRSVGHNIWVADNGAIRITLANGTTVCLDKPGLDSRTITRMMDSVASTRSSPASRG